MIPTISLQKNYSSVLKRTISFFNSKKSKNPIDFDTNKYSIHLILDLKLEQAQINYAHRRQLINASFAYASAATCLYIDQPEIAAMVFGSGYIYNISKPFRPYLYTQSTNIKSSRS